MERVDMYKLELAIKLLEEVRQGIVGLGDDIISSRRTKTQREPFPFEILKDFQYQEDKTISHLLEQIQAPAEGLDIKKISPRTITTWLKTAGYLTVEYCQEVRKESTMPTEKGEALGIYTEVRSYGMRTYLTVIYNRAAQEFLVRNLEAIVNGEVVE